MNQRTTPQQHFVGEQIWFKEEKRPYTVQALSDRFVICTKPSNPRRTVLYTIIDLQENIRGTENLVFCAGFETRKDCEEALERLVSGETEVSHRNQIPLKFKSLDEKEKEMKVYQMPGIIDPLGRYARGALLLMWSEKTKAGMMHVVFLN